MFRPFQSFASFASFASSARCFSTTSAVEARTYKLVVSRKVAKKPEYKVGDDKPIYTPKQRAKFPDYKYGESHYYQQSNKGLYGGQFISTGNRISESKIKNRRTWKPNVSKKSLWSEALKRDINVKLTARVLRTISKEGGVDKYLVKDKSARIKELGPTGWKLRYLVRKAQYQAANPPHKDVPTYKKEDGKQGKIYFPNLKVDGIEEPLNLIVGKRKLTSILFQQEKIESKALGETISVKDLTEKYFGYTVEQLASSLAKLGYDMKQISYSGPINLAKVQAPKADEARASL